MGRYGMLRNKGKEITVGGPGRDYPGFTSRIVQLAVDEAAGQGGGIVRLDKGTFAISGPIRLSDGVSLVGAGPETVLRKVAGVKSRFIVDADYGELRIEVEEGSGFRVGMGIQVFDESQKWGWAESTAVITAIEGNVVHFDRYLARDYRSDDGGTVTNACSVIEGVEVEQVRISDLRIDGNKADNEPIGGCRAGGIYLHKAKNCRIDRVMVEHFRGDGISWQITENISVQHCVIRGCEGSGLHPGAGTLYTSVKDNVCSDNGSAGLFICWRVQHGEFERNTFARNGNSGISIGHKDSDNLFADNVIRDNAVSGVYFRPEKATNGANRNTWIRNVIVNNENYGVYANDGSADNEFKDNVIPESETQATAMRLADGASGFLLGRG
ncbi:right-handed parallel beta-helix repeat-containing protein [Cohnella sp.]|uniref:right-handed parallel beta-helix repeat-containing protein n=1 Tax=Cohnella sp. TaxID=1883426 RepID=UPI003562CCBA